jgi:2,3-bisphosphoglycerate-dependent phosphoglycerate mutase
MIYSTPFQPDCLSSGLPDKPTEPLEISELVLPTPIYLIRHAESQPDASIPEADWPLSEAGQDRAVCLRDRLIDAGIEWIYSSPYKRAIDTIKPLAEAAGLINNHYTDLRERRLKNGWVNDFVGLVRQAWTDVDFALPGCESSAAAQQRIVRTIEELVDLHTGDCIAVSSHGNIIGLYLNAIDPSFGFENWQAMRNPDVFKIVYNNRCPYCDTEFRFEDEGTPHV